METENFQSLPVCGFYAGCVGPVMWCEDFENFQTSPVCGPCVVMCEDFENFQNSLVCGLYAV